MRIAITGGTGLIGNALGKKLTDKGHSLVVFSRRPQSARESLRYPCEVVEWSGEGLPPVDALQGLDAFVHLAGENVSAQRWSKSRRKALRDSRLIPLENLKRAYTQESLPKLKVFLSASAVGYYGDRGDEELTENSAPGSDFLADLCREWEHAASLVPASRHVQVRFGVVVASTGGFLEKVAPLFTAFGASRLGSGRQWISWIHIEDAARAIEFALENGAVKGPLNAVSPNPVTNAQLTQELKNSLNAPWGPPAPALGLKALYGSMSDILLGSQKVIPKKLLDLGFQFRESHLHGALDEIYSQIRSGELQLVYETWIEAAPEEIWPFFCDERNLEKLTPAHLSFEVLGKNTKNIEANTKIDYRIKLRGIPMRWTSQIGNWDPPREFSDEQIKGPYKSWLHSHSFRPLAGGTLMTDTVRFRVPGGWAGRIMGLMHVKKEVEGIFTFRAKAIRETFYSR